MRSQDPYLRDLLRDERSLHGRRRSRAVAGVVVAALGLAAWSQLGGGEEPAPTVSEVESTVREARRSLSASLLAAQQPIEVTEAPGFAELAEEADAADEPDDAPERWVEGTPTSLRGSIKPNESVFASLKQRGLSNTAIHAVVSATSKEFNFRKSRPGDSWSAEVAADGTITSFRYETSPEDVWETTRDAAGTYACAKVEVPLETRLVEASGQIDDNMWASMEAAGLASATILEYLAAFDQVVDFGEQVQPGDRFALVYEQVWLEGRKLRNGKVVAALFEGPNQTWRAYWNPEKKGYYDAEGASMERQFLRRPVAGAARFTSPFGMRFHPVLKRKKMHNGVDYAAPRGTPVFAAASGTIVQAGRKGAAGISVTIRHDSGYESMYGHLAHLAVGIKRGKRVSKRDVIGGVGSTGRSTGPHLHFGVKRGGRWVDPLKVSARPEPALRGAQKAEFTAQVVAPMRTRLDQIMQKMEPRQIRFFFGSPAEN
jgi:murein DD-endopeptidase MepM/ murein hydrolase activator NlpD